jgi:hypothetical protein
MSLKDRMTDAVQQLQQLLVPYVRGESLSGSGYATRRQSAFKQDMVVYGVTPTRLIFVGADRRWKATGEVIELTPGDIRAASVDGYGAGIGHFFGNDGEIWIDTTAHGRLKLCVIANGVLERAMLGGDAVSGTTALCEWLAHRPRA